MPALLFGDFGGLIIPATGEDCLVPSLCRRCTLQPPANECILPLRAQFFFCMHVAGCLVLPVFALECWPRALEMGQRRVEKL